MKQDFPVDHLIENDTESTTSSKEDVSPLYSLDDSDVVMHSKVKFDDSSAHFGSLDPSFSPAAVPVVGGIGESEDLIKLERDAEELISSSLISSSSIFARFSSSKHESTEKIERNTPNRELKGNLPTSHPAAKSFSDMTLRDNIDRSSSSSPSLSPLASLLSRARKSPSRIRGSLPITTSQSLSNSPLGTPLFRSNSGYPFRNNKISDVSSSSSLTSGGGGCRTVGAVAGLQRFATYKFLDARSYSGAWLLGEVYSNNFRDLIFR